MKSTPLIAFALIILCCFAVPSSAELKQRPYRLNEVSLKQRIIWGAEIRSPDGTGLAFGGQDQDAENGRPHTRLLVDGQWQAIDDQLRRANPLKTLHHRVWELRNQAKHLLARTRFVYFQGLPPSETARLRDQELKAAWGTLEEKIGTVTLSLPNESIDDYTTGQLNHARRNLKAAKNHLPALEGPSAETLQALWQVQIHLEDAAIALGAEPPARAMDCGTARITREQAGPSSQTLVYDPHTQLYLLFGGDHLDYLTNDTWVFDLKAKRWYQRHPQGAPPPRANHRLKVLEGGKIQLTGGYTYASNPDYLGGQYIDLDDGDWTYDIEKNEWSGGKLSNPEARTYRTGPFAPDYYFGGPTPDAKAFAEFLRDLPANQWVPTNPPFRPRLNRDWGTARIDPDRDLMLRYSGGHSAHGGSDVPHFHFATNRWELPFPVEFPLGQLYSNTSYPNGYNFNRRPWITGHTYQNYAYDPPSRKMIKAGRPRHFYVYDPDKGDWTHRGMKPPGMQYSNCFYTLTLTATPNGVVSWGKNGQVHRYDHKQSKWQKLNLNGEQLPGAYVDNSSIVYDAKRDRLLMLNTLGYQKPFDGTVWSVDMKTLNVKALLPEGRESAHRFANVDKSCYDANHDLLLLGSYLTDSGDHAPTPAYDCENNRWITIDLKYSTGERYGRTTRAFPHTRSDALMHDAKRQLIWGTDTNSQVYVLRVDLKQANVQPLK